MIPFAHNVVIFVVMRDHLPETWNWGRSFGDSVCCSSLNCVWVALCFRILSTRTATSARCCSAGAVAVWFATPIIWNNNTLHQRGLIAGQDRRNPTPLLHYLEIVSQPLLRRRPAGICGTGAAVIGPINHRLDRRTDRGDAEYRAVECPYWA